MSGQVYEYVLKSDKLVSYSRIGIIFFAINIVCLLLVGYLTPDANQRLYAWAGGGLSLLWLLYVLLLGQRMGNSRMRFTPGYGFLFFLWIKLQFYWVAPIVLLLALLDYIARRPLVVRFATQQVHYPAFPPKAIAWAELQNVVLKDGLLTIDFTNNKMLQAEIEEEPSAEEAAQFNAFARQMIKAEMVDSGTVDS
jgi:hypothetical protein